MRKFILLFLSLLTLAFAPATAEESKVYTDLDLERYKGPQTFDHETIVRRAADLSRWEVQKETEERLQREREVREAREEAEKEAFSAKPGKGPPEKTSKTKKKKT